MFSPRFIGARNFLRRFDFYKFNALEKKLLIGGRQGESNDISVLIPVEFHESLIEEIFVHIDRFYPHIAVSPMMHNQPTVSACHRFPDRKSVSDAPRPSLLFVAQRINRIRPGSAKRLRADGQRGDDEHGQTGQREEPGPDRSPVGVNA